MGESDLSGPPERTISLPTRTLRPGSRQRMMLAVLVATLLLLLLADVRTWALLGPSTDGWSGQTSDPDTGRQERAGVA